MGIRGIHHIVDYTVNEKFPKGFNPDNPAESELAAELQEMGHIMGLRLEEWNQDLVYEGSTPHQPAWLSKKARDSVATLVLARIMKGINLELGLPGDHQG
jgi:hypothetical protein